ncbi:DNA adenine methylase [Singulisphaera acidiphila]|uniref:site-specific DNA-methyltransferase (adenine-specific) n=1 Tax=Singulisphaera acidiphila (strain ATCC BAA-1392 / DSM 18658 / VKM B-2454 / MOB10) TaxID=886293 RepID=L0DHF2_SINAD|nr:DNA adenine methylase [Singulisphaera acidiphila]AGA28243.1 site-specific DNA methylase [Singulisphaera acidiphila DSM 18658]
MGATMPLGVFEEPESWRVPPFKSQLLKWIGNKQRFAHHIVSYFPPRYGTYYEPFLGSASVLATLAPAHAIGSDLFRPLTEIWQTLHRSPETLLQWYTERRALMMSGEKVAQYEKIKASYNAGPNAADLLFLCRSCYGGVVRFRKGDGHMSTRCGVHTPIPTATFAQRVREWSHRTAGTTFLLADFEEAMSMAKAGDLVYCDPPYTDTQTILYGAQSFSLVRLFQVIGECKSRGVKVALSLDGTKRSGEKICTLAAPDGLFEQEARVHCGRSMLRRFQMGGQSLEGEVVADRLLLTYRDAND